MKTATPKRTIMIGKITMNASATITNPIAEALSMYRTKDLKLPTTQRLLSSRGGIFLARHVLGISDSSGREKNEAR